MVRRVLVAAASSVVLVSALHAECVGLTAREVLTRPGMELVFAGRVVDIQDVGQSAARVTFAVERVWKGSVPARIDLYFGRFDPERPQFAKGAYAVAVAKRLKDLTERRRFGLPDSTAPDEYEAFGCTDGREQDFEENLGTSHPPKQ